MGGLLNILGVRVTSARNQIVRAPAQRKLMYGLLGIGAVIFFVVNFLVVLAIVNLPLFLENLRLAGVDLPPEVYSANLMGFSSQLLTYFYLGATVFLLIDSVSTALPNIYQARDLPLLLSSPLGVRQVFFSKMIAGLGRPYLLLLVLGLPYLLASGIGFNYDWPYYVLAVLSLVLLPLLTGGIGVLLTALLVRWLPANRITEALAVIGGLIGIAISAVVVVVGVTTVQRPGDLPSEDSYVTSQVLTEAGPLPTTWIAFALRAVGRDRDGEGLLWFAAFAGLALFAFVGGTWLSANLFYDGWTNLRSGGGRKRVQRPPTRLTADQMAAQMYGEQPPLVASTTSAIQQSPRTGPLWGTWRAASIKDLRILGREPAYVVQLLGPALVTLLFMLQARQSANLTAASPRTAAAAFITVCLWVLFISSFASGLIGLSAFSREQKSLWMLKLAPVGFGRLVFSKFMLTYLILVGFGTTFSILYSVLVGARWYQLLLFIVVVAVGGLGASSICVGVGTLLGNLNSSNPQSINLLTAITSLIGLLLYQVLLLAGAIVTSTLIQSRGLAFGLLLGALPVGLFILAVTLIPLNLARRRLARLDF